MADNEHLITAKFFDYKYQPGHSVMAYVAAIEQMAAHLKNLNAPMSDVQIMSTPHSTTELQTFSFCLG